MSRRNGSGAGVGVERRDAMTLVHGEHREGHGGHRETKLMATRSWCNEGT